MSTITLSDGTTIGDVVIVFAGNIRYGKVLDIDNKLDRNVTVKLFGQSFTTQVYGSSVQKLTEEVVANRRQQLTTELQELEAAWELAKHK